MKTETAIKKPSTFSTDNFHQLCDRLAEEDQELKAVIDKHGYPPMWTRDNSFKTLVHIILEQQVSLASALATLIKLEEKISELNPENILCLNDDEMRACYVSRQKASYIRGLAQAIKSGEIDLKEFETLTNDDIRNRLVTLKGIGNWTIDVYLMFVLQRSDIFPVGDLAAVNALKRLKQLPATISREEILQIVNPWTPLRSVACMILWHYYLSPNGYKEVK